MTEWTPGLEPWEDEETYLRPPEPTVWEEPNEVTGVILGPDGETILAIAFERRQVPFGFQPPVADGGGGDRA